MIKHILKLIWKKKSSNALLLLEIFLSFLVLFAVLSYVTFNELKKPLGFETKNKWLIHLDDMTNRDSLEVAQLIVNLREGLISMDKVREISFTNNITTFSNSMSVSSSEDNGFLIRSKYIRADDKLKDVLDINMLEGRWFTPEDGLLKYSPMVVSKNFMEEYYPKKSMVDSVIQFNGERKIVGVMEDFRYRGQFTDEYHTSFFYRPYTDRRSGAIYLDMSPDATVAYEEDVFNRVSQITKSNSFTISNVETLRAEKAKETWIPMVILLSICAFLCLNVALGLFGVLWYNINKRRSEVGLRRALGAHHTDISKQFILEILILAGFAITIGTFFAVQVPILKVTEMAASNYYIAIIFSIAIVLSLVLICAYFPSRQAAKIAPATALHED
jgi:putative ABC transport system permease protein